MDSSLHINRKDDHVRYALDQHQTKKRNSFDDIRFVHQSIGRLRQDQIDLSTHWAGQKHDHPFYINAMTGGSPQTKLYNQQLAQVAAETGLAMAVGSISAALKNPQVADSFTIIRKENPHGFVLANLGPHHDLTNAEKAVDLIQANALQIHLNTAQEVVMPEGDRDFSTWKENIQKIVDHLSVPVIVKEVGFGMSRETIQELLDLGVQTIDLGGRGGTNFVQIENHRNDQFDFSSLTNWGQTSVESLLESLPFQDQVEILASGGIRDFLDVVKALALGARSCGIAGKFLHSVDQLGVEETIQWVEDWTIALKRTLLLLSCQSVDDLGKSDLLISGESYHWARLRQIDLQHLANRRAKQ
ncbi:type 2 isopentenyl-diphosphate Delta-isomerase [Facklamia miroungae]|uniref:Isopentenyl-diphosphate delta-isomerase n=1 Tax=Facklamia miroungae TaxID=120956 RepID=A0A1G7RHZ9_9LACT|nr:type 2 isopentenyl-diphosphate Delta-isomerase [Facklamia miroungae]NKZ29424.1 type 2 isopentenyl-diphosphate Delta-isomerase [Facklamia miroungae]SDG09779.1 isopentenyl-diphosphate delta-isomerase [Facklamia miroungae]